jgi:uroporphyrin-III C-methyltransferase/precorrin-2 dehydrogenase/sirohydrochlorin ferrochelatase
VHIALRSADPDDLTLRDARWLARADIIYHDASTPPAILRRARADARCIQSAIPNEPSSGVVLVLHGPS